MSTTSASNSAAHPSHCASAPFVRSHEATGLASSLIVRSLVYLCVLALTLSAFPGLVERYEEAFYEEGRMLENSQNGLIVAIGLVFLYGAWRSLNLRSFYIALSIPVWAVLIREQDKSLDEIIPVLGWKAGVLVVLLAGGAFVYRRRHAILRAVERFVPSLSFGILWSGAAVMIVLAQLVGHGDLFRAQLGDDYNSHTKRLVEESIEFGAYMLLLFGAIESFFWGKHLDGGSDGRTDERA